MKKVLLSLALLTVCAAMHARGDKINKQQTNKLRKDSRAYIKHSGSVDTLPISDRAKMAEKQDMATKGRALHDAMDRDHESHQDARMPKVKEHAQRHARDHDRMARAQNQD